MANSITVWTGNSSLSVQIANIKQTGNIEGYNFLVPSDLGSSQEGSTNKLSFEIPTDLNSSTGEKSYEITGHLVYKNAAGSKVSNTATGTVNVRQRLTSNTIKSLAISPTEVWSNADPTTLTFTTTVNSSNTPYSTYHTITGGASSSNNNGTAPDIAASSAVTGQTTTWTKSSSSDLGAATRTKTFLMSSIAGNSTDSNVSSNSNATVAETLLIIKNAVTELSASSATVYKGDRKIEIPINYGVDNPYSYKVSFYTDAECTKAYKYDSTVKVTVALYYDTQNYFTFDASDAVQKTTDTVQTIYIKSEQCAGNALIAGPYTFTAKGVSDITDQAIQENASNTFTSNVGTIASASVTSGGVTYSISGDKITITAPEVTTNTEFSVTVTGTGGATMIISGTITNTSDNTLAINTGDRYTMAMNVGTITSVSASNSNASATISGSSLVVDATSAGSTTFSVVGSTGATQKLVVTIEDITLDLTYTETISSLTIG